MNIAQPKIKGGLVFPGMKVKPVSSGSSQRSQRITIFNFLPDRVRNHFVAMCGEFAGTFLFLFFAFSGTQVANTNQTVATGTKSTAQIPNTSQLLYVSLAFGFSLAVNAWVFFRISGGLFNPAVSFGMCLIGAVPWVRGVCVVISQILGGIAAAGVVSALFPGELLVRTNLAAGTSVVRGLFIEMFLTAQLVFTIFMLAAEKHKGTFIAPIGIGLSLFIAELSGVYYTGGSLNPARSFGPCVVLHEFAFYHWIYWVGPILGTLLACGFYKFIKALEYETANPGQDLDDKEAQVFDPEHDITRPAVSRVTPDYVPGPNGDVVPTDQYHQDVPHDEGVSRGEEEDVEGETVAPRGPQPTPLTSAVKGGRGHGGTPTYPATEGAANWEENQRRPSRHSREGGRSGGSVTLEAARKSRDAEYYGVRHPDAYGSGPDAEAGRYNVRRSSGRR
ncbi:aquaporin rerated other eukaryote [Lasallia pustulata]|uniref:Aquaporin rerated other eukaryote n=1 Tax=Lasallia pustulata TaxID=136370 RepID=A0A1W5CUS7_9LECA|nr:aquaporin rerated other eukaryote [Lasallia pustulata]